ncbi:MAG: hypothetical protein HFJ41_08375 [Clostridia bacterium]|nr:hypothetical protein [Clostridia bacterium]
MIQKKIENIKADYLDGMKYKDIFKKYNITLSDLKKIIYTYKLTRDKRELYKGNQNAKNNKGGTGATTNNKNAVVTGEYEKIYLDTLTEEEKKIYSTYKIDQSDIDNLLMNEYITEYKDLMIRKIRMMKRIQELESKERDMTIDSIKKKNAGGNIETITEAEPTINIIQKIEDSLTRVNESMRKSRENMIKLGFTKKSLELKEKQIESELW